jgi:hypothetical protein
MAWSREETIAQPTFSKGRIGEIPAFDKDAQISAYISPVINNCDQIINSMSNIINTYKDSLFDRTSIPN